MSEENALHVMSSCKKENVHTYMQFPKFSNKAYLYTIITSKAYKHRSKIVSTHNYDKY